MSLVELLRNPDLATPRRLLEEWHGRPTARLGAAPPDSTVPQPLREFDALYAAWPELIVQNSLIAAAERRTQDGKLVFYVENQGVYLWATEPTGVDPPVWGRFNEDNERWQAEREPLSRFLIQIALLETVFGAQHGAGASFLPLTQVEAALAPLEKLAFGSWRWPGEPGWFYASDELLAFVCPNGRSPSAPADHFDIWIAARSAEPLRYLTVLEGIRWDQEPG